jgi:hypothetical protein
MFSSLCFSLVWDIEREEGDERALQFLGFSRLEGRSQSASREEGSEHDSLVDESWECSSSMEEEESRTIWISMSINLSNAMSDAMSDAMSNAVCNEF